MWELFDIVTDVLYVTTYWPYYLALILAILCAGLYMTWAGII